MSERLLKEIVLAEDNQNDVELTLRAFRKQNLSDRVEVVKDGVELLERIESSKSLPKVIFLDLKMPRLGGLEALRRLKASEKTKTIPVVVLTSSQEEQDLIESYELGVNSYVVKPLDFRKFFEAISQLGLYWLGLNRVPLAGSS